jgi:hypothetical protein
MTPRPPPIEYMHQHLENGWDWAILAFCPLISIGAVLLAVGLWRALEAGFIIMLRQARNEYG